MESFHSSRNQNKTTNGSLKEKEAASGLEASPGQSGGRDLSLAKIGPLASVGKWQDPSEFAEWTERAFVDVRQAAETLRGEWVWCLGVGRDAT